MPSCALSRRYVLRLGLAAGAGFWLGPSAALGLAASARLPGLASGLAAASASGPAGGAPLPGADGSPFSGILAEFAAGGHRFACERAWAELQPAAGQLRAILLAGGASLSRLLAPSAHCAIAPRGWSAPERVPWATIRHAQGGCGGAAEFHAWLQPQAPLRRVELDCTRAEPAADRRIRTVIRFFLASHQPWQASGEWTIAWQEHGGSWRISEWRTDSLTTAQAVRPLYTDVTETAFGADPSFRAQMLRDTNYWRSVLDDASGIDIFGNYGVSVGDADGDGEDEIYVCQPQGLPNRLYRRRRGGAWAYEDIAAAAGVDLLDATSMALFADLRNRGRQDLILITQSQPLVFWNEGGGRFRLDAAAIPPAASGASLTGAALADYDGDGWLDLYVCSYGYFQGSGANPLPRPYFNARNGPPNHLYRNRGDGSFAEVTAAAGLDQGNDRFSFACFWLPTDAGRRPDLLVINDFGENNYYRNLGGGRFEEIAGGLPGHGAGMSAAAADFSGRGLEVYVGNMWTPAGLRVTADPAFAGLYPGVAGAALREMAQGNRLYQPGTGAQPPFTAAGSGAARAGWAWSCDAFDPVRSGRPGLYCVNGFLSAAATGRRPVDSFFWEQIIARSPLAAVAPIPAGYQASWRAGFHLAHSGHDWNGRQRNVCFLNLGGGRFADISAISGLDFADDGRAFALFDAAGGGSADLILRSRTGPQIRLLRHQPPEGQHCLAICLRGAASNRDAIGARLTLRTAAGSQIQLLQAGSGFLSQHSKQLIFGLGSEAGGDLRIEWPSGAVGQYPGLAAGFRYAITEGDAAPRPTALRAAPPVSAAPAEPAPIPRQFVTPLVDPLPLPPLTLLGARGGEPSPAGGQLWWLCAAEDAAVARGLPGAVIIEWPRAPARLRAFCRTVLRYLYDCQRAFPLPTGLLLHGGALRQVFWGGAERAALAEGLRQPPPSGAAALPFRGRALLCSFQRDPRALGGALETAGLHAEAAVYLQAAARLFPRDAEVFFNLGLARRGQGQAAAARAAAQRALALQPHFAAAENLLGVLAMDSGQWNAARREFERATRDAPAAADGWNNLGYAQMQQGDLGGARTSLERALALAPGFANALNNRGILAARQNHPQAAARDFRRALAADPNDLQAGNNLAVLLAQQGETAGAIAAFQAVLRRHPEARGATLNLARLQLSLHDRAAMRKLLAAWLQRHPGDAAARALLRAAR